VEYAIAVIDIGMTNKKVAVYDDALRQLDAKYRVFEPLMVRGESGGGAFPANDLEGMEAWFLERLAEAAKKFPVRAIAVTTHGANFVCLGKNGRPALPCVFYTHEPGRDFQRRFYERFGAAVDLQERTGTPALEAMINPAKGLFFAKEQFPAAFKNTSSVLPYPQYWGFRLTGKTGAESTYMGCHTYLWDQMDNCLSSVARELGIAPLLPATLQKSWDILGTISEETAAKTGLARNTIVTLGIHDSNASLLPHFAKKSAAADGANFVLNSTGTWCVIMNPVKEYGFAKEELGKVVFFNISAFGTPVKTAIFLGGQEFETWSKAFMARHGRTDFPGWNEALYRSILGEKNIFLMPELTRGSGQFPASRARIIENGKEYFFEDISSALIRRDGNLPPCFSDYEKLFAVLRISLVMQTLTALERTGVAKGREIYVEGGFRRDESYNRLLSSAFPENRLCLTDIAEATALGAAMTAKMAISGKGLSDLAGDFEVAYQEMGKSVIDELVPYREAWLGYAG
jgi:sugar (pentulose or hexulose) kinase